MVTSCGRAFDLEILDSSVDTSSFLVELCGTTMYCSSLICKSCQKHATQQSKSM